MNQIQSTIANTCCGQLMIKHVLFVFTRPLFRSYTETQKLPQLTCIQELFNNVSPISQPGRRFYLLNYIADLVCDITTHSPVSHEGSLKGNEHTVTDPVTVASHGFWLQVCRFLFRRRLRVRGVKVGRYICISSAFAAVCCQR